MAVASLRLERYAALAALPACALGSVVTADIIYTELNLSIRKDTTSFTMADAMVLISAYESTSDVWGRRYLGASIAGGGIALNGGMSVYDDYPEAQGFAAGEAIGEGALFGEWSSWANLAVSYSHDVKDDSSVSGGDWFAEYDGESRLYLGVEIANGSDVNYGWIDIGWSNRGRADIYGYAYETDVNTAIVAGATESAPVVPGAPTAVGLVGLAAGAAGIRRKRSA